MSIELASSTESIGDVTAGNASASQSSEDAQSASSSQEQGETTEESEASETEDDADLQDSDDEERKPKQSKGIEKRIKKLTSKISEKERENEFLRQELYRKRQSEDQAAQSKAPAAEQQPSGKPNPDHFDTHAEYLDALFDYKVEQRELKAKAQQQQNSAKTEFEKKVQAHSEKVQEFKKTYGDFDDVMDDVDDVKLSVTVEDAILDSENGPELMYELAKNKEELKRICALPPVQAARELGRFEAKIAKASQEQQSEPFKTTKAPPPIAPVGKKATSAVKKSIFDKDIGFEDYERLRKEQMKSK